MNYTYTIINQETMTKTIIKAEPGRLLQIYNNTEQPGKMLIIRDGNTVLAHLPLDEKFTHSVRDEETGEEVKVPGLILDMVFTRSLQAETDGKDITQLWL